MTDSLLCEMFSPRKQTHTRRTLNLDSAEWVEFLNISLASIFAATSASSYPKNLSSDSFRLLLFLCCIPCTWQNQALHLRVYVTWLCKMYCPIEHACTFIVYMYMYMYENEQLYFCAIHVEPPIILKPCTYFAPAVGGVEWQLQAYL